MHDESSKVGLYPVGLDALAGVSDAFLHFTEVNVVAPGFPWAPTCFLSCGLWLR